MSTIEFTCSNCSKTFRVRSEFAGKSTHCPGCSQPVRIGVAPRALPTATVRREAAPSRGPIGEPAIDDSIPSAQWLSLSRALKREHRSVTLLGVSILFSIFAFVLGPRSYREFFAYSLAGLASLIPVVILLANMLIARLDAMKVPQGAFLQRTARAARNSFYPALASFIALALTMVMGAMEGGSRQSGSSFHHPRYIAPFFGFLFLMMWLSLTASMAVVCMLVAQVGIRLKSLAISQQIANMAWSIDVFLLLTCFLVLGGGFYFVTQSRSEIGQFLMIALGCWIFLLQVILTLQYRRLLEVAREVVSGKE
jgi:DNA-directed RNA polymerase subunit RPC12/RpoP